LFSFWPSCFTFAICSNIGSSPEKKRDYTLASDPIYEYMR
jgi:hypothetical protein